MKELSIEEKAKRYDEAIERARVWKEKSGMPADRQGILDDIFPELKVSEDEEVRKALYEYFKKLKDDGDIDETWYGFSYDKILAWLEKKGEQNLANSAKTCKDAQNPAWSENDENFYNYLLDELNASLIDYCGASLEDMTKAINWFKSLKERYSWKPSDEQIMALRWVLNNIPYDSHKEEISGLLDQIKDL